MSNAIFAFDFTGVWSDAINYEVLDSGKVKKYIVIEQVDQNFMVMTIDFESPAQNKILIASIVDDVLQFRDEHLRYKIYQDRLTEEDAVIFEIILPNGENPSQGFFRFGEYDIAKLTGNNNRGDSGMNH